MAERLPGADRPRAWRTMAQGHLGQGARVAAHGHLPLREEEVLRSRFSRWVPALLPTGPGAPWNPEWHRRRRRVQSWGDDREFVAQHLGRPGGRPSSSRRRLRPGPRERGHRHAGGRWRVAARVWRQQRAPQEVRVGGRSVQFQRAHPGRWPQATARGPRRRGWGHGGSRRGGHLPGLRLCQQPKRRRRLGRPVQKLRRLGIGACQRRLRPPGGRGGRGVHAPHRLRGLRVAGAMDPGTRARGGRGLPGPRGARRALRLPGRGGRGREEPRLWLRGVRPGRPRADEGGGGRRGERFGAGAARTPPAVAGGGVGAAALVRVGAGRRGGSHPGDAARGAAGARRALALGWRADVRGSRRHAAAGPARNRAASNRVRRTRATPGRRGGGAAHDDAACRCRAGAVPALGAARQPPHVGCRHGPGLRSDVLGGGAARCRGLLPVQAVLADGRVDAAGRVEVARVVAHRHDRAPRLLQVLAHLGVLLAPGGASRRRLQEGRGAGVSRGRRGLRGGGGGQALGLAEGQDLAIAGLQVGRGRGPGAGGDRLVQPQLQLLQVPAVRLHLLLDLLEGAPLAHRLEGVAHGGLSLLHWASGGLALARPRAPQRLAPRGRACRIVRIGVGRPRPRRGGAHRRRHPGT
mmetsp:Transcript_20633/g.45508  ORF Transcript_20633/g.45508 Transcript_20633/m.45508 type:complete len:635 (+) Transcript_20633:523-2427(+)